MNSLETATGGKYFDVLWELFLSNSSEIRQKRKSQDGGNKKAKHAKFFEKRTFLTLRYVGFLENLACFVSCYLHLEICPFALLPTNFPIWNALQS